MGSTKPQLIEAKKLNGLTLYDYSNSDLDMYIGNDLGKNAYSTGIHEPIHFMTSSSPGDAGFTSEGLMGKSYKVFNTTRGPEALILRGKGYEHKMVDYNDSLLPSINEYSGAYLTVNNPEKMKNILINSGVTPDEADNMLKITKKDFEYMLDKQENQTHLKEVFLDKIAPYIKNPNNASEIEEFLLAHPEIIENNSYIKNLITSVRPGTKKEYATALSKMLYSLFGTGAILNYNNNQE